MADKEGTTAADHSDHYTGEPVGRLHPDDSAALAGFLLPREQWQLLIDAMEAVTDAAPLAKDWADMLDNHEEAVEVYSDFWDFARVALAMRDVIGQRLIDLTPDRYATYPLAGGGTLRYRGGHERKRYDQPRLIGVYARRIREVMGLEKIVTAEGEVGDAEPIVDAIVSKVATATGATAPSFTGWRAGIARELDIALSDYCETDTSPVTVSIEGRGDE